MRELLTIAGALLIIAFSAAFAAPLYIDWNDWRGTIEQKLSAQLGAPVTISGRIEARILPQPWLSVEKVRIGPTDGPTRFAADRIEADLSLTSLVQGEAVPTHAVLRRPLLTIWTNGKGEIAPLAGAWLQGGATTTFEIDSGAIRYVETATGHDIRLDAINVEGEARPSARMMRADGQLAVAGVGHSVRLAADGIDSKTWGLKLSLMAQKRAFALDLDGQVAAPSGPPIFTGTAIATHGAARSPEGKAAAGQAWRASGLIKLTSTALLADKFDLQLGPEERALKFIGKATASLNGKSAMDVRLAAKQLDIDRFIGNPAKQDFGHPPLTPAAALAKLNEALPKPAHLAGRLRLEIGAALLAGQRLGDIRADLHAGQAGWELSGLTADLPGQTHLALSGAMNGGNIFHGRIEATSRQAPVLTGWLQGVPSESSAAGQHIQLAGNVTAKAGDIGLSGLRLSLGEANVSGQLGWMHKNRRLEGDLVAERLDLDALSGLSALLPGGGPAEVDIRLKAQRALWGGLEAKSLGGHIKIAGGTVEIDNLRIDDLGGTSLSASGRVEGLEGTPRGDMRLNIDGRDLSVLARALEGSALARALVPASFRQGFAQRAAALSPANAAVAFSFGDKHGLVLDGKFAGSVVSLAAEVSGGFDRGEVEGQLKLESLDAAALLRQLGLPAPPDAVSGRGVLTASVTGPIGAGRRWALSFDSSEVRLKATGRMTGPIAAPAIGGRLSVAIDDLYRTGPFLGVPLEGAAPGEHFQVDSGFLIRDGNLVLSDLTGVLLGSPISGSLSLRFGTPARIDGRLAFANLDALRFGSLFAGVALKTEGETGPAWSGDVFGPSISGGLGGTLAVSAKAAVVSPSLPPVSDLQARVTLQSGTATIDGLQGKMAGGEMSGWLKFLHTAPDASLAGRIALAGALLQTAPASGKLDLDLEFQGSGRSPAAMLASLTGGGTLGLALPRLAGLSEQALVETVAAAEKHPPDDLPDVAALIGQALARQPLSLDTLKGTLQLSNGTLRLVGMTGKATAASLSAAASLNLSTLDARAELALALSSPEDGLGGRPPAILVIESGSPGAMTRRIDASALQAWLILRAADRAARTVEQLDASRNAQEQTGRPVGSPPAGAQTAPALTPSSASAAAPSPATRSAPAESDVPPLPPPLEIKPAPQIAPSGL